MQIADRKLRNLLAAGVLVVGGLSPAFAEERPSALQVSAGIFNIGKSPTQAEVGFELRSPLRWWRLDLAGGVSGSEEGSVWGHVGLRRDFDAGPRFVVAPGFAFALYERGDGKDLGGSLQFRSSIDFGYRVTDRGRLGLLFYHLSNAGLEKINPGANSAVLTWSIRLR